MRRHETLDCQCGSGLDGTITGSSSTCRRAGADTGTLCKTLPLLDLTPAQRMLW